MGNVNNEKETRKNRKYANLNDIPDAYGLSGERVNSWQLFKDDELAREKYEEDED